MRSQIITGLLALSVGLGSGWLLFAELPSSAAGQGTAQASSASVGGTLGPARRAGQRDHGHRHDAGRGGSRQSAPAMPGRCRTLLDRAGAIPPRLFLPDVEAEIAALAKLGLDQRQQNTIRGAFNAEAAAVERSRRALKAAQQKLGRLSPENEGVGGARSRVAFSAHRALDHVLDASSKRRDAVLAVLSAPQRTKLLALEEADGTN